MADKPTVQSFTSNSTFQASKANNLADQLATAVEGCLGRGGTGESPNSMTGNLDMDLYKIQNLGAPIANNDAARLVDISDSDATGAASATLRSDLGLTTEGYGIDLIGNGVKEYTNIAAIKAITAIPESTVAFVKGYYTAGDNGGGYFYWDSTSTETDNSGTIIKATVITVGRWKRIYNDTINIKWFGAKGDNSTDDSTALTNVLTYINSIGGGILYFPNGNYKISTVVNLIDNVTLLGNSDATIIADISAFLTGTSKSNIKFKNLKFEHNNHKLLLILCSNIHFEKCEHEGLRTNSELTQQGIWTQGVDNFWMTDCVMKDFRDAVYLEISGTTPTKNIFIQNCYIYQDNHGTVDKFPTGIYLYKIKDALISNCVFENIIPGDISGAADGYGIYEGDGQAESVTISNCVFEATDTNKGYFNGIHIAQSPHAIIKGCTFKGDFPGVTGNAPYITISSCIFEESRLELKRITGVTAYYSCQILGNIFIDTNDISIVIQDVGSPDIQEAIVANNYFRNAVKGAIWARYVDYATIVNNTIIDCNTSNDSNDYYRGGINFYGCTAGYVDGNKIENTTGGSGHLQYGVVSGVSAHAIDITENNRIINMDTGIILRYLTAAPTTGYWAKGSTIHNWSPAGGGTPGWVCVTSGTPGTWKARANLAT